MAAKEVRLNALNRWLLYTGLTMLLLMSISRLVFFFVYFRKSFLSEFVNAFILGFRYDLRMACIIILPIFLLSNLHITYEKRKMTDLSLARIIFTLLFFTFIAFLVESNRLTYWLMLPIALLCVAVIFAVFRAGNLNPFQNKRAAMIYQVYFGIFALVLALFYVIDFCYFDYLHHRLNASILNFVEDAKISAFMVVQSYPVLWLTLLVLIISSIFYISCRIIFRRIRDRDVPRRYTTSVDVTIFCILALGIFGSTTPYPLRWGDAFTLGSDAKANVALNPMQSFFSSMLYHDASFNLKKVKEFYPLMSKVMGVETVNSSTLSYLRRAPDSSTSTPNVVLVICESFSAYKSSMWGNPLNTTPTFNEMTKEGIFFENCYTPAYGTARGIWALITGIPDVEIPKNASRNPAAVDQHTILNEIKGYEKFYMIGGSSSWANIQGLLLSNIEGMHLLEQQNYKSKPVDIWGISDKRLFYEANEIFKAQTKPFFGIIQTADNHPPYSIPGEDLGEFKTVSLRDDELIKYGFASNDELNAFRYFDFCVYKFIEAAKREKYFEKTIFVFVGDHGMAGKVGDMFPKAWEEQKLTDHHVPLLFYAPGMLMAERKKMVCSQLDVIPSIAGLIKKSYTNTTLGRDVFANSRDTGILNEHAFIFDPDEKMIGIVIREYCYTKDFSRNTDKLLSLVNNDPVPVNAVTDSIKKILSTLAEGYLETGKYMLLNNKK